MTDRFDEAKRSLEGVSAPDVWAEAERRASDSTVIPLAAVGGGGGSGRRPGRWLAAAAAAAALVAGTVAVLAAGGEDPVDTAPGSTSDDPSAQQDVTTYQADGACKLGIRGEPLPEPATVSPAETFVTGSIGTRVEGSLNRNQTYAVQVPGQVVIDLVGERVEDVQLGRGTGQLWFQADAAAPALAPVQVRWFTGSQEPCESFTVTVAGGTEDENRHAAVDLADRVLMSNELPGDPSPGGNLLANTEWQLERATVSGDPTEGGGLVFSFGDDTVDWTDGCNNMRSSYTYADGALTVGEMQGTIGCPNTASDAINAVMATFPVAVTFDGNLLVLRGGDGELVLRPRGLVAGDRGGPEDPGTDGPDGGEVTTTTAPAPTTTVVAPLGDRLAGLWEIVELQAGGASQPLPDGELLVEFFATEVSWTDGCTGHRGHSSYTADSFTVADASSSHAGCPEDVGASFINGVFESAAVAAQQQDDRLTLTAGDRQLILQRA